MFLKLKSTNIHIVVLHQYDNVLFIGKILPDYRFDNSSNRFGNQSNMFGYNIHFGHFDELYDPFTIDQNGQMKTEDVEHFLSQLSTSRYMHCPKERQNWNRENNVKPNKRRVLLTKNAISCIKSLARSLKIQFWAMCGTLLGKSFAKKGFQIKK